MKRLEAKIEEKKKQKNIIKELKETGVNGKESSEKLNEWIKEWCAWWKKEMKKKQKLLKMNRKHGSTYINKNRKKRKVVREKIKIEEWKEHFN